MKGVIASAVIAVVIVAGSVAYTNHIDKVSRELGEINDRVMAFLYDGDYESAGDEIEKLVQYLDENRTVLAATGNHEDFDKIEMNISEVEGYINGGEQTDAVSHCRVLGFLFEHLPKSLSWKIYCRFRATDGRLYEGLHKMRVLKKRLSVAFFN